MRIVYLCDLLLPRTATDSEQIMNMVAAFGAAGATVDLVVPRRWGERLPTLESLTAYYGVEPTFRVHTIASAFPSPRGLEKAAHAVRASLGPFIRGTDFVYSRNVPTILALRMFTDRRIVYEHYRPWPDQSRGMRALFETMARDPRAPALVLHSELAAASYERVGFLRSRMLVAHNGWDPRRMQPALDRAEARARCRIVGDGPVVLYAGHVNKRKGIGLLLDLAEAFPHARFVIIGSEGDGPIERRAATIPNVDVRRWVPPPELVPYLYAADVLAIPPTAGPLRIVGNTVLPMKTFLYMASERAIFGPATPDLHEVLRDGENARLVKPDDPADARRGLGELLASAELRERLGRTARTDALGLTWKARAEKILAFLGALS
jgi:glycosyltransferase involved in cell wall biosynthesis